MNANVNSVTYSRNAFDVLRRFAPRNDDSERCELCSLIIGDAHQHLFELTDRNILCACDACAILFSDQGNARYRRVPSDGRRLENFQLHDSQWESLGIPIGLAFFFYKALPDGRASETSVAAFYPSPAGATESLLDLTAWVEIEKTNPMLREMLPDVEALLVNRIGKNRDYYIVPIDECYKLIGVIRTKWRGLSGGQEVWAQIEEFFRTLPVKTK